MPPIFSIPSCVFIGPLGNTNVGGRLTSQEVAVLLVGCHFLGGRPTSQEDANLHVKISKNSTWWSSSLRTRIPKKRLEVV